MYNNGKHVPKKSVTIFTCKECKLPQEVEGMSSKLVCKFCRPVAKCAHGVNVTVACDRCWQIHRNSFMRVM